MTSLAAMTLGLLFGMRTGLFIVVPGHPLLGHLVACLPGIALFAVSESLLMRRRRGEQREAALRDEQARLRLEESEARYRQLIEMSPDALVVTSAGRIVFANPAAVRIFGASGLDELLAAPSMERVHPDYRAGAQELLSRLATPGAVLEPVFLKMLRLDGTPVDVEVAASAILREGTIGAQIMIRDLTDRHDFDRTLNRYRLLSEYGSDVVLFVRPDGRMIDVNRAAESVYQYSREELLGMNVRELRHPDCEEEVALHLAAALAGGVRFETRHVRRDGTELDVEVDARGTEYEGERLVISVCRDITSRRAAQRELEEHQDKLEQIVRERTMDLERANARLLEASNTKSAFLANMSHELRTPLNSIIGFSGTLSQGLAGDLNEEQARQIRMVNTSGRHLLALVNDLLDLERIEAGGLKLCHETFPIAELAAAVRETVAPLAEEKGLVLDCDVAPDAGLMTSDRLRMEQVLLNLLGNAVKYTSAGSIGLLVSRRNGDVEFAVSDTGIGISDAELPRIFDEFHQVARHDVAKPPGTGLGLAVSKRLVEALGGSLTAASETGVGSTFTVRVPVDARPLRIRRRPPRAGSGSASGAA